MQLVSHGFLMTKWEPLSLSRGRTLKGVSIKQRDRNRNPIPVYRFPCPPNLRVWNAGSQTRHDDNVKGQRLAILHLTNHQLCALEEDNKEVHNGLEKQLS